MSSDPVIQARGLGKRYDIYERPWHRFLELLGGRSRSRDFWAVRHVDFEVRAGETVGIVGRNGSGKSTLLQMICGTLQPTEGTVEVRGRVAALLELGAGFNPEFTGRENVYLNASLMGLSRAETDRHFDGILAFADIGDFIDQPVRTYSSGMYVRLAFAVAIAAEPDLLVVDEALAVGDEAFQRKCFARIEALKARGTAVLFVSHAAAAVVQLCDRAILMDGGEKWAEGEPKAIIGGYHKVLYSPPERRAALMAEWRAGLATPAAANGESEIPPETDAMHSSPAQERFDAGLLSESTVAYVSRGALIESPELLNLDGDRVNVLASGHIYRYRFKVRFERPARQVHFGMLIKSMSGVELFGLASHAHGEGLADLAAGEILSVEFRFRAQMLPGAYFLNAGCVGWLPEEGETYLHRLLDALMFRVESPRLLNRMSGFVDLAEHPVCSIEEDQRP